MRGTCIAICLGVALAAPFDSPAQTQAQSSARLRPLIDVRLRSEHVQQGGMADEADAVTLRARLGFETRAVNDTVFLAEAELISPLEGRYNSTVNGRTEFPVVLDPESYEVNRLQLVNASLPKTRITVGRQRIVLADHRFVGNAGWRQNEQTYDAIRIVNESVRDLSIDVAYVDQVNRPDGKDAPAGRYHGEIHLANVSARLAIGQITAFAYLLDIEEAPTESSRTLGVRLAGSRAAGPLSLDYTLSCARQRDHAANPLEFEATNCLLDAGARYRGVSLGAGREVLTGDGTKGFATPLATLHAHQGWADKFLTTPADGIVDRYVKAGVHRPSAGRVPRLSLTAVYHDFDAERGRLDFGSETDVLLRAEWKRMRAGVKFADYEAAAFASDTRKAWAEVEYLW